ncbi:hypothetical protein GUJ93_ZPchr0001g32324 [Zizania palustris]|uniref:Uncharacterized protein n=1 Tax=Zizania palustris TaxID=103762 RepID=A0A8J5VAF3_ZIZPA|nr:hypothetical protein GUJ93_ZPchr0001g32324 [Zizania palustris]
MEMEIEARISAKLDLLLKKMDERIKRMDEEKRRLEEEQRYRLDLSSLNFFVDSRVPEVKKKEEDPGKGMKKEKDPGKGMKEKDPWKEMSVPVEEQPLQVD